MATVKRFLWLWILLMSWQAFAASSSQLVRVRLSKIPANFQILGADLVFQGKPAKFRPASRVRSSVANISFKSGKKPAWKVQEVVQGVKGSRSFDGKVLAVNGSNLRIGDESVPSRLLFFANEKDVDVIAVIDLEKYLEGVLASEMPASWPLEALKAQAVASRTYAVFQMRHRSHMKHHMESSILDQVFDYKLSKRLPKAYKDKVKMAVRSTRGLVLTDRGRPIQAFYHADCGGVTEEAHDVWGNGLKYGVTRDHYCSRVKRSAWNFQISRRELGRKVKLGEDVANIEIEGLTGSGRIATLLLSGASGKSVRISGQELRRHVGFTKLKSTLFQVHVEPNKFSFFGRGNGHGSGLCQWGTRAMARSGKGYEEILGHYYPKASLRPWVVQKLASL